jgi:hypothetical protein
MVVAAAVPATVTAWTCAVSNHWHKLVAFIKIDDTWTALRFRRS